MPKTLTALALAAALALPAAGAEAHTMTLGGATRAAQAISNRYAELLESTRHATIFENGVFLVRRENAHRVNASFMLSGVTYPFAPSDGPTQRYCRYYRIQIHYDNAVSRRWHYHVLVRRDC